MSRPDPGVRAAAQLLPLAVLLLGAKLHKVAILGWPAPLGLLRLLAPDLALCAALWLCASILLRSPRRLAPASLQALTQLLGAASLVEHGFFVATGSFLDGNLLIYGVAHAVDLRQVLLHGMPSFVVGAFAATVAAIGAAPLLARLAGPGAASWHPALVLLAASVAATLAAPAVADHLMPLRRSPLVTLSTTLAREALAPPRPTTPATAPPLRVAPPTRRHNVVLIMLESTRASATSLHSDLDTTPHLVALAARGAHATQAYTVVPHTTKALVAIHCGIPPTIDTWNVEAEPGGIPHDCLPTVLRRHGWATALFQSVDESYEKGERFARRFGYSTFRGPEHLPTEGFDRSSYFGYEDDVLLAPAFAWVDRRREPFLLTLLTVTPHHDYRVPRGFERRPYSDDPDLDGYLNGVRYVDRFVGKVVAALEARALMDRTLILVLADHGEGFGEHRRRQHDNVIWEEGLHIPLVVAGPGIAPGTAIEGLRQSIDVMPTVLEVLGARVEQGALWGRSLLSPEGHPVLRHACHYHTQCMAERTGTTKQIHHFDLRPAERFDLTADPSEWRPLLVDDPVSLQERLLSWKQDIAALYGHPEATLRAHARMPPEAAPLRVPVGPGVALTALVVSPSTLEPGDEAEVTADFAISVPPGPGWSLGARLRSPAGSWTSLDHVPAWGAWPVESWAPGPLRDRFWLEIPEDAPEGDWQLVVGLRRHHDDGTVSWAGAHVAPVTVVVP
ncbi:MAG: hypothetical protein AMXMBFR64_25080 [Myxococcales bacterium]